MRSKLFALSFLLAACGSGVTVAGPVTTRTPEATIPPATTTIAANQPGETSIPSSPTTTTQPTGTSSPRTTTTAGAATELVVFFLADGGDTASRSGPFLIAVHREGPATLGVARAALEELIVGPSADEQAAGISSAVPSDTLLLGVTVVDSVATVDLSREFEAGGGSFSMFGRLAQLVFTVTQFPTVEAVELRLDGEPVTIFGSEGLVLEGPIDREDYLEWAPTIMVESPAYGGTLGPSGRITGFAAVFEATFQLAIVDGAGSVIAQPDFVMTDNGVGWGSFDVTVPYQVPAPEWGTLRVWAYSAEDGSEEAVREYPVLLLP
ncbi:MAG: GerMN domain-containing protein [Acidimicrobiia bacterium]